MNRRDGTENPLISFATANSYRAHLDLCSYDLSGSLLSNQFEHSRFHRLIGDLHHFAQSERYVSRGPMQWLAGGIFELEKTARNRLNLFRGCARRLVAYRQYTNFLRNRLGYFELVWCAEGNRINGNWMKAHELLSTPDAWCQESPAEDAQGNKVQALNPKAVKWCALAAVQKTYPPSEWEQMMDRVLRALSVSEKGITQLTKFDKACSLMEWNDDRTYSFRDIREVLIEADV